MHRMVFSKSALNLIFCTILLAFGGCFGSSEQEEVSAPLLQLGEGERAVAVSEPVETPDEKALNADLSGNTCLTSGICEAEGLCMPVEGSVWRPAPNTACFLKAVNCLEPVPWQMVSVLPNPMQNVLHRVSVPIWVPVWPSKEIALRARPLTRSV